MLAYQGLAIQSIKTYVAAVKHENVASGNPDLVQTPRLRQVLQGAHRLQGSLRKSCPRARLPISLHLLKQLKVAWSGHLQEFKWCALWAATTLCFFGFFRSGEITIPTLVAFNSSIHLSWGDVAVDSIESPTCARIHLKRSKCDQMGKGVDIYVGTTGDELCPVTALLAYIAKRGTTLGAFFLSEPGTPLTKGSFVVGVREGLHLLGVDERLYAGHSFRIGAATTAAQVGMEESLIQKLGRWNSAAFLSYVRTPPDQFVGATRQLSRGCAP